MTRPCPQCGVRTIHRKPEPTAPPACIVCGTEYTPTEVELEDAGQTSLLDGAA